MKRYKQGKFVPKNPTKYIGDPTKIVYRSSWELKVMKRFDLASWVQRWSSETTIIPYISPIDNRPHRYFVDFSLIVKDKEGNYITYLVEVKPFKETKEPINKGKNRQRYINEVMTYSVNQAKWKAARQYCEKKGWKFIIMTEKDILDRQ
jgi:hypothetical protein